MRRVPLALVQQELRVLAMPALQAPLEQQVQELQAQQALQELAPQVLRAQQAFKELRARVLTALAELRVPPEPQALQALQAQV